MAFIAEPLPSMALQKTKPGKMVRTDTSLAIDAAAVTKADQPSDVCQGRTKAPRFRCKRQQNQSQCEQAFGVTKATDGKQKVACKWVGNKCKFGDQPGDLCNDQPFIQPNIIKVQPMLPMLTIKEYDSDDCSGEPPLQWSLLKRAAVMGRCVSLHDLVKQVWSDQPLSDEQEERNQKGIPSHEISGLPPYVSFSCDSLKLNKILGCGDAKCTQCQEIPTMNATGCGYSFTRNTKRAAWSGC